ncbi:hypothetical protein [Dysgonomonas sp. ZJ279]|uniref:hypothetical protein n=1 Tax=Dysgonomonas sp. ZJ279 TaxID=2709796 RepID=UPI0013EE0439|nr:hypothetical protein [Dysgonomonas sp. ZJ279]
MNTKLLSRLFILVFITSFTLISCDNEDDPKIPISTDIVGVWTYKSTQPNVNVGDNADLGKQIENFISSYNDNSKGSTYKFADNGTYIFSSNGNEPINGTYKLTVNNVFELNDNVHNKQTAIIQDKGTKTIYISLDLKDVVAKELNIDANKIISASLIEVFQK